MHDEQHYVDPPVDEIHLRIQALADNELPEEEIDAVLAEIQGSYEYRNEYADLLRMKRRISGTAVRAPEDWLARAEKRVSRRISRGTGLLLFVGSYVVLIGYALFTLFREPSVPLIVSVLIGSLVLGLIVLLVNAIADRVRESKTDKYRELIR